MGGWEGGLEILVNDRVPCVLFEDEHLLVINKPAGLNTHSAAPFASEGIYDWLRHREPRWADLAIVQRLDKETSGVMVFGKTTLANRALSEQFSSHSLRKKYHLLTDRPTRFQQLKAISALVRAGDKYLSRPLHAGAERAETHFRVRRIDAGKTLIEAEPVTGRTHQIRVHAAEHGFPILGDTLYGGTPAERVCLHAAALTLRHPVSHGSQTFAVETDFSSETRSVLRTALMDVEETNAFRLVHGGSDGWPGWYVDRLGDYLLSQADGAISDAQRNALEIWLRRWNLRGAYHKVLTRRIGAGSVAGHSPDWILGDHAPESFVVRENGLSFELSFREGYSVGLFLDQRENRRRFLTGQVAAHFPLYSSGDQPAEVLNAFAYTCAFSVCAAKNGARVTSLDLSRKYLDWGKRNFLLNALDPARHEYIQGDAFDWFGRLAKKGRRFDVIVLDPPTFSRSKQSGAFQAEKDFGTLARATLPLLKANGVLLASTNAAKLAPEKFLASLTAAIRGERRSILQQHYQPQPPDFPTSRGEPAYLKTVWIRIG